jgi:hypothetical protein
VGNRPEPEGLYCKYIRQLGERRAAEGKPPAEDICGDDYWQQRKRNEELKQLPRAA